MVWELPRHASVGISLFPLHRELVILLAAWLLLIGRNVRPGVAAMWLTLLIIGLLLIREGGRPHQLSLAKSWTGFALWGVAMIQMIRISRRASRAVPEHTVKE